MVSVYFHLVAEIGKFFVGFRSVSSLWICWVHSPTLHLAQCCIQVQEMARRLGVWEREGCAAMLITLALSLSLSLCDILTKSLSTPLSCYLILQISTL